MKGKIPRSEDFTAKKLEPFCEAARMKGKIPLSEDSVRNDKSEFLGNLSGGLWLWGFSD
jgi:hypothetical protein